LGKNHIKTIFHKFKTLNFGRWPRPRILGCGQKQVRKFWAAAKIFWLRPKAVRSFLATAKNGLKTFWLWPRTFGCGKKLSINFLAAAKSCPEAFWLRPETISVSWLNFQKS